MHSAAFRLGTSQNAQKAAPRASTRKNLRYNPRGSAAAIGTYMASGQSRLRFLGGFGILELLILGFITGRSLPSTPSLLLLSPAGSRLPANRLPASHVSVSELCLNAAAGHSHGDGLHGSYLIISDALLFGDAKVMLHSRRTTAGHSCSQMDEKSCLWFQKFIVAR